jgi:hypothetical protein
MWLGFKDNKGYIKLYWVQITVNNVTCEKLNVKIKIALDHDLATYKKNTGDPAGHDTTNLTWS